MTDKQRAEFSRRIKHLMIDKDVTQRELAAAAGVSDSFMSMVLSGTKTPTLGVAIAVSNKLGVTIESLIQ